MLYEGKEYVVISCLSGERLDDLEYDYEIIDRNKKRITRTASHSAGEMMYLYCDYGELLEEAEEYGIIRVIFRRPASSYRHKAVDEQRFKLPRDGYSKESSQLAHWLARLHGRITAWRSCINCPAWRPIGQQAELIYEERRDEEYRTTGYLHPVKYADKGFCCNDLSGRVGEQIEANNSCSYNIRFVPQKTYKQWLSEREKKLQAEQQRRQKSVESLATDTVLQSSF